MTLDPDRYQCPEHHTDLTSQVEEALDDQGPPVAYYQRRNGAARPFLVMVTCPGSNGSGQHSLTCSGTYVQ